MRVTILGSSGQIGAYLTEYLRDKGHEVTEFDKNNSIDHDMTKIPNYQLRHAIKDSDFVFFLAFDVGGSRYLKKYQHTCLLYTSPSPRDRQKSRMPSSA